MPAALTTAWTLPRRRCRQSSRPSRAKSQWVVFQRGNMKRSCAVSRPQATTSCPALAASMAMCRPINPPAPTTRIRMGTPLHQVFLPAKSVKTAHPLCCLRIVAGRPRLTDFGRAVASHSGERRGDLMRRNEAPSAAQRPSASRNERVNGVHIVISQGQASRRLPPSWA